VSSSPPSSPSLELICNPSNPIFPFGATLKYLFEIKHSDQRKLICIDIAHGCVYEVYRIKSEDVINVAATDISIIFHVKPGHCSSL
jgi:hypothetical protein